MMILRFITLISLLVFNALAALVEEGVYIEGYDREFVQLIESRHELTIDHADQFGFELYGPKGTKKWLKLIGVKYKSLLEDHHHHHLKSSTHSFSYPSFEDMTKNLKRLEMMNPKIVKLFSIGQSVEGRELWVIKLSKEVNEDKVLPEFKYISSMHGDEITGRELTQFLIEDMIKAYGQDKEITSLIDNTEIYIMPSMNPDGSARKRRGNANGVDLNRNFPEYTRNDPNQIVNRQPETVAVMNFQAKRNFSMSANFHGGAVCVNYPWDATYTSHPFEKLVKDFSLRYAYENPEMRNSRRFRDGITNGADWYVLRGGMQDWSYAYHNDLQVTVELSDSKWPNYRDIPGFYKRNKDSMLEYLKAIHQGAGFYLKESKESGLVKILKLNANGQDKNLGSFAFKNGEFYKALEVGEYRFEISVDKSTQVKSFEISVEANKIYENGNFVKI